MKRAKKIEIKPIDAGPAHSKFDLTLYDKSKVLLVNMIPEELSDESGQDSEPFLAVHPNGQLMIGAAYTFTTNSPSPKTSPLYLSTDGGWTWVRQSKVPESPILNQSYCFSGTGKKLYGVIFSGASANTWMISVLESDDPTTDAPMKIISRLGSKKLADQPFIQARKFDQDRIYVGQNYFGPELGRGKTASVRVSTDDGKTFRLLGLEARSTMGQDGPSVRPAIAPDGTVYAAFFRWTSSSGDWGTGKLKCKADIIVTRDDEGATGSKPFRSLIDPMDGKPGRIVAQDRALHFSAKLGKQRIGSDLSLAVDPNNSGSIYLAWADLDPATKTYTIHLKKSIDRGLNWSKDLLAIPLATNPAVAVSSNGSIGFLYQQLRDVRKPQERWETHFQSSLNGFTGWTDIILASFLTAKEPALAYEPYLGDKIHLLAIANNFYGTFSAPNIPERKYFPQGVHFQRAHKNGKLLSVDGKTKVTFSIDPYFFRVHLESDSAVSRRVDNLLAEIKGPALANYSGFVTAGFFVKAGRRIEEIGRGETCELRVQFGPRKPKESWAERIDVNGGEDAPQVAFRISVDAADGEVTPDSKTVVVAPGGNGDVMFKMVGSREVGSQTLFIQIFQKTRLIQVVAPTLIVRARKKNKTMSLLRAPGLRIDLAKDGQKLVMIDAKDSRHEIPCRMSDVNASEYRKLLKLALDQLKDSVRKENLTVRDTAKALDALSRRGRTLIWQIFSGTPPNSKNCDKVVEIFHECFPAWLTQREPAVIAISAEFSRFVPLEFLPLFDFSEWLKIEDWEDLEAAARRFPGFSAVIRRDFPDVRVSQNLVLENDPKLPMKCFYHRDLNAAEPEMSFFKRNAGSQGCLDFDGPWPDREYDEGDFSTSLARHLRCPDRRFNGMYRRVLDQIQHFVCHCEIDEEVSSLSRLLFSEGNFASIADLQAGFLTIKGRKDPKDGPLVFLNACGTSRIDPMAVTSFPRFFLQDNFNRGFIGTETNVPDAFAAEFSQSFYRGLLTGLGVGQALYNAKWDMLRKKNNPLGMLYVVYADPDLHVSKRIKNLN